MRRRWNDLPIPGVHTSMNDFEAFFAREYPPVFRALTVALGDRRLAEDAAQEGFARAFDRWASVSMMHRPTTWVYVVGMNRARDHLRHRARLPHLFEATGPGDPAESVAAGVTVRAALGCLNARQRETVVLRYLADLTVDEIAEAMGCPPGTVKSTLHRALSSLRIEIQDTQEVDR